MPRNTRSNSVTQDTVKDWASTAVFIRDMFEDLLEAQDRETLAKGQDEDRLAADAYRLLVSRLETDVTAELTIFAERLLVAGSDHER